MLKKYILSFLAFLCSPCKYSLVWIPYASYFIGFALMLFLFLPAKISTDSFTQYCQLETKIIGDWHSPILAASWQFVKTIYHSMTGKETNGSNLMYIFSTFFIWCGLLLILISGKKFWKNQGLLQKPRIIVFLSLFLFFWICVDIFDGPSRFSKDSCFLGSYLFAAGCLLNVPKKQSLSKYLLCGIALIFLTYGTALRYNSIFSALPLLFWIVWLLVPRKKLRTITLYGLILWIIMLCGINFISNKIIHAVHLYPLQEIFYLDIWHLNARTPQYIPPPDTFGNHFGSLDEKTFRDNFDKEQCAPRFAFQAINQQRSQNEKFWFESSTVVFYPDERKEKFSDFVAQTASTLNFSMSLPRSMELETVLASYPNDYRVLRNAWFHRVLSAPMTYIKFKTVFFYRFCKDNKIHFMGLNALTLIPFLLLLAVAVPALKGLMKPSVFPGIMLAWSALLYIFPLWAFLVDDTQLRYLLWFFAASLISIVLLCFRSKLFSILLKTIFQHFLLQIQKQNIREVGNKTC